MDDQKENESGAPSSSGSTDMVIHEYDGIQEYDNELPRWWLYTLFGTVIFAGLYWCSYSVLGLGDLPRAEYEHKLAADEQRSREDQEDKDIVAAGMPATGAESAGPVSAEALLAGSHDAAQVTEGRALFGTYCVQCHGPDGGGKIGPNLTDSAWIHGVAPDKIYKQIMQGSPSKGMIPWGPQLGSERVKKLTAFVLSIKNTNVPGGKAPQGTVEN